MIEIAWNIFSLGKLIHCTLLYLMIFELNGSTCFLTETVPKSDQEYKRWKEILLWPSCSFIWIFLLWPKENGWIYVMFSKGYSNFSSSFFSSVPCLFFSCVELINVQNYVVYASVVLTLNLHQFWDICNYASMEFR